MSNYNILKTNIAAQIKQNGAKAITGQILQTHLLSMITSLGAGYQYIGVAALNTNPGTPDYKCFYIATAVGTYSNFGSPALTVAAGEVAIFYYDTAWHKAVTGAASKADVDALIQTLEGEVTELGQKVGGKLLNNSFVGNGNTYVTSPNIVCLIPGHTYRIYPKNPNWDKTGVIQNTSYLFYVGSYYNNTATQLVLVKTNASVGSYYDFTIPANSDYVVVGGRAAVGTEVEFAIEDLTYIRPIEQKIETYAFNSIIGKYWYYQSPDTFTIANPNYIASIKIPVNGNAGDVIYWKYSASGATANNVFLVLLDSNDAMVDNWLANNSSGARQLTASGAYSQIVCCGYLPTSTFYPYVTINGEYVWCPKLGYQYDLQKRLDEIDPKFGDIQRKGELMLTGGSFISYDPDTYALKIPNNANVRYNNNVVYVFSAATTITLTNTAGFVVLNVSNGSIRIATTSTTNLSTDEYILFGYNRNFVQYTGKLVSTLPQESVTYPTTWYFTQIPLEKMERVYANAQAAKYAFGDNVSTPLQLLWFSDLHARPEALHNVLFAKTKIGATYVDDVIATGDQVAQYYTDDFSFWNTQNAGSVLQVIGNHEVWKGGNNYATAAEAYTKFFSPYISGWGVTSPGANLCYYYKDYATSNIRLIVLDCMNWDTAQKDWLVATLASAKTAGLNVLIAQHYLAGNPTPIACNYTALNVVANGIISNEAPQAVQDFIDGGGKFVCWIGGHYHADYLYQLTNFPGQYGILIGTASRFQSEKNNFRGRPLYYNLFSLLQVDVTFHQVKMVRLGVDVDRWMRHKELVSFDYQSGDVIVY